MKNLLAKAFTNNDSKMAAKANLTIKISGLTIEVDETYTPDSRRPLTSNNKLSLESCEISGDFESTMTGFFKLIGQISSALQTNEEDTEESEDGEVKEDYKPVYTREDVEKLPRKVLNEE